jgi:hypothetical protein
VHMMPRALRALQIAAVVLTVAFLECTDPVSPYVPTVTNEVDNFDYQVSVSGVTRTVRYTWTTTGNAAVVNLASTVTAGTASLTITDPDSAQVFDHALDGSGPTITSSATSGDWMLLIRLSNVSGTIHFSLQKP